MALLDPVGALAYRRRHVLLVVFVALCAAAGLYGRNTARDLVASGFDDPASESSRADAALDARFGLGTPDVVVAYTHPTLPVRDPAVAKILEPVLARLGEREAVQHVSTPYGPTPDALVSRDGRTVVSTIRLSGSGRDAQSELDRLEPLLA